MKKLISFLTIFVVLLLTCTSVLATNININTEQENNNNSNTTNNGTVESSKTVFQLVDKTVCEINLDDKGNFRKELTNFDAEKKELTITLTVANTMEEEQITNPIEIYFVLDSSESMVDYYQDKEKAEYVKETANEFA